jgi:hypothetical protein
MALMFGLGAIPSLLFYWCFVVARKPKMVIKMNKLEKAKIILEKLVEQVSVIHPLQKFKNHFRLSTKQSLPRF